MSRPIYTTRISNDVVAKVFKVKRGYEWTIEDDFSIIQVGVADTLDECKDQIDNEYQFVY